MKYLSQDQKNSMGDCAFNFSQLNRGESIMHTYTDQLSLLIVTDGELRYKDFTSLEGILIRKGQMVLVGYGATCELFALENVSYAVFSFTSDDLIQLGSKFYSICRVSVTKNIEPYLLNLTIPIKQTIASFRQLENQEILSQEVLSTLYRRRIYDLLFLMFSSYQEIELVLFFASIASNELEFIEKVYRNYRMTRKSSELAQCCGYSVRDFSRKFQRTFKMTPYKWMQLQLSKEVFQQLTTTMPLKDIIYQFEFTSPSHFTNFCKKYFGSTPNALRKSFVKTMDISLLE